MPPRHFDRATRGLPRQSGLRSDTFDRFVDTRQRRAVRQTASASLMFGISHGETAAIERRFLADAFAPIRN